MNTSNKFGWGVATIIAIVIIAGGAGGCAYFKIKNKPSTQTNILVTTPTDETIGWKTYTTTGYWGGKCSIKYPDTWKLGYEKSINVNYLTPKEKRIPEDIWVWITCFPKEKGYEDERGNDLLPFCSVGKFTLSDGEKFEGIHSKEFCTLNSDGSLVGKIEFQVRYGRQGMDYYIPDKEFEPEFNVFKKMLSTFRFIK